MICFKSPRDKTGIRHLLLQVYPDKWRQVLHLFLKLTSRPFGYFMLDLHPASEDCFRIWSHLTCDEGATQVHTFDDDMNSRSLVTHVNSITPRKRVTKRGRGQPGVGRQYGGIAPLLAALLPALAAGGKAAAVGAANAEANYGVTRALKAAGKKKYKRKTKRQQRLRQQQLPQYGSYE